MQLPTVCPGRQVHITNIDIWEDAAADCLHLQYIPSVRLPKYIMQIEACSGASQDTQTTLLLQVLSQTSADPVRFDFADNSRNRTQEGSSARVWFRGCIKNLQNHSKIVVLEGLLSTRRTLQQALSMSSVKDPGPSSNSKSLTGTAQHIQPNGCSREESIHLESRLAAHWFLLAWQLVFPPGCFDSQLCLCSPAPDQPQ